MNQKLVYLLSNQHGYDIHVLIGQLVDKEAKKEEVADMRVEDVLLWTACQLVKDAISEWYPMNSFLGWLKLQMLCIDAHLRILRIVDNTQIVFILQQSKHLINTFWCQYFIFIELTFYLLFYIV